MTRRLLVSYLTLTFIVLAILEIPLGITFARHERRALSGAVERDAFVLASQAEDVLEGTDVRDLNGLVSDYRRRTGARVVIVNRDGMSIADSDPLSPTATNFSTRPEIKIALRGEVANGIRRSETLGRDLLFVAVPVASGRIFGAVRITYPTSAVDARIRRSWMTLGLVAVVVFVVASLVGLRFASSVTKPLKVLERSATTLARGDLSARVEQPEGPPEVRSLGHAFNDMAARLEELVVAQRSFVDDASHQLRTPLTALRLRLETLEEEVPAALSRDAEAAVREALRLETIVEGLLALSRAEGPKTERRRVEIARVIADRQDAWAPLAADRSVSLNVGATDDLAWEIPGAVHQILDNLLANAIQASPPGSTIRVSAAAEGATVVIHVVDEGRGMTEGERLRAFDRFWRAPDREEGGSGLGLAIVRQLARASGGEAHIDAAPGGGLDAWVALERVVDERPDGPGPGGSAAGSSAAVASKT